MAQDISGFGLRVVIKASVTFPVGITITQFADDADPLDSPALTIAETGMGLNGDLVSWSKPNTIPAVLSVVPNSEDDINLGILAEANRVGRGKFSAQDEIEAQFIYPDGTVVTKTQGKIVSAIFGLPVASAGRMKSKPYGFQFENIVY